MKVTQKHKFVDHYIEKVSDKFLLKTAKKIQLFFMLYPKASFAIGLGIGLSGGFLAGLQTGTLLGYLIACAKNRN